MTEPITEFSGANSVLSNFTHCVVSYEGMEFVSVEHAYQAAKTLDLNKRELIRLAPYAGKAKRMGGKVVLRDDWEAIKVDVMLDLLVQKFSFTNRAALLLATGNAELVEGNNWHDNFWGVCHCPNCRPGSGQNMLGKLLMGIRAELREES